MKLSKKIMVVVVATAIALFTAMSAFAASPSGTLNDLPQQSFGGVYIKSHRVTVNIDNQVAVTKIEQVFANDGPGLAEGTYLFPLPEGAAVTDLSLTINGETVKAQILDAKQAQNIYTEIVRRRRDPVLLQYIGRNAIQANVFPIPAGEQRTIDITYSNVLSAENGLFTYQYPLRTDYASPLPVRSMSLSVNVTSKDPISTVYSPDPLVAVDHTDEHSFKAGFEATNYRAPSDFSLYYGVVNKNISANLLTYRASADEDGYFMLMLTPPTKVSADQLIPKDVILVLDQSGSMQGTKWKQAQAAASYVLKNLNPEDRFNAITFSTGYHIYAKTLQAVSEAPKADKWIQDQEALGGTDINGALLKALSLTDKTRQTVVLFMTDGMPTDGVTNDKAILNNISQAAPPNLRIFAFGVGDDVDPFLLDSLSTTYGGTSVYVRPKENIEQKISTLYTKIMSPVLTNIKLDFGSINVDEKYPAEPLPDLFAGSQLIVVGRFRDTANATITLTGNLNGQPQTYTYDGLNFPDNAGGQAFIPRLWATRKIGSLLTQIRLSGENKELIDAVTQLSVRYGIITPYTSFLITENNIQAQQGESGGGIVPPVKGVPLPLPMNNSVPGNSPQGKVQQPSSGAAAIDNANRSNQLAGADQAAAAPTMVAAASSNLANGAPSIQVATSGTGRTNEPIKQVNDRTFILRNGVWTDSLYTADTTKANPFKLTSVIFLSDDYFKLLTDHPEIKDYLAIGDHVIVVIGTTAYEVKPQ